MKARYRIGFFLHTPFPSFEIFRMLPVCKELVIGVLGSDLVGFHVYDYVRHFVNASISMGLGVREQNGFYIDRRNIFIEAFPIGIDFEEFEMV